MKFACETVHPGTPPRISVQNAGSLRKDGTRKPRKICLECKCIAKREQRMKDTGAPYGVVPLTWEPPRLDV